LIDMESIPKDTRRDAFLKQIDVLRGLGTSGRAAMALEFSHNLRQIVKDGVRHRHPDWDEGRVQQEALRIVLGDRLYNEAFGKKKLADE
jgi:hypothetical protein